MTNTILTTLDTLQYANKLKAVGVPEKQAEVFAETAKEQNEAINKWVNDNLATKQDLEAALKELEYRLTNQLTIRFGYMLTGAVTILGILISALKFVGN
jgi:hypothetical protein